MDFSEDWKSEFPIGSVPCAPLLLSEPSALKTLGPLLFSPSPGTRRTVYSPPCTHFKPDDFAAAPGNNLVWLECPDNDILVFYPTGDDLCQLECLKLSLKEGQTVKSTPHCEFIGGRIAKIAVSPVHNCAAEAECVALASKGFPHVSAPEFTLGFLLACTTKYVHWFRINWTRGGYVFVKLASKQFSASVIHACWSPHINEESLVLLDGGDLILVDCSGCSGTPALEVNIEITKVDVVWKDSDLGLLTSDTRWLSCEFASHFRTFVVACSDIVYQVDLRFIDDEDRVDKSTACVLAKIELFGATHLDGPDEFVTFCRAGGSHFCIASKYGLYLLDTKKPLSPVLQWAHKLDKPTYMQVFKLSELRRKVEHEKYSWATGSGSAILLGSFRNNEFSFFCYGPPLQAPRGSVASIVSDLCHTFYAWGLPSDLSLSGRQCYSGDCLIQEEFFEAIIPKKEIVLGFCIVNENLVDNHLESGVDGSFVLIRLMSSGKIESQVYNASSEFVAIEPMKPALSDPMDLFTDQSVQFRNGFVNRPLDYLLAYLFGDLAEEILKEGSGCIQNQNLQDEYEYFQNHLKAAGIDQIGSLPDIAKVLTSVSVPVSINEIAVSRMWSGLSAGALQLGFLLYPGLLKVNLDSKKASMDFLHIPKSPQLPPFLLRVSRRCKTSQEVLPGDALGPVFPLPVLLNLHRVEDEMITSAVDDKDVNESSFETKLAHDCSEIMEVASAVDLPGSSDEFLNFYSAPLDDSYKNSTVSQEVKSLIYFKPTSFTTKNSHSVKLSKEEPVPGDIFLMKANKSPSSYKDGLEIFDDLCPIELKFDSPVRNFEKKELDALKILKKQFFIWQQDSERYKAFAERLQEKR